MKILLQRRRVRLDELERALDECARLRRALERMTDNALFAAGQSPLFEPEAPRFQPRATAAPDAGAKREAAALSPAQWRRRLEEMERLAAERDRRARLAEELKNIASERRRQSPA